MAQNSSVIIVYRRLFGALLAIPAVWFGIFFLWPTINALATLVSLNSLTNTLSSVNTWAVVWFTTWQALISVLATLIVSLPVTWVLARFRFSGAAWVRGVISTPFVLPTVVVAGAVMSMLPLEYQFGVHGIILAHVLFNIAVVVRLVGTQWAAISHDEVRAASTLGASPLRTFVHITFPQLKQSLLNASVIIFVFTFTSFGVVSILGGVRLRTVEVEIYTYAVRLGQFDTAMTLALLQIAVIAVVVFLTSLSIRNRTDNNTSISAPTPLASHPRHRWTIAAIAYGSAVFVAIPFLVLFLRSLRMGNSWSLSAWRNLGNGSLERVGLNVPEIVLRSLWFAAITVIVVVPFAYVVASSIAYMQKGSGILQGLTSLPIIVSAVTLGFGIIVTFDASPFDWRGKTWLLPVVHALIALPLVVRTISPALQSLPHTQRDAAQVLGASPLRVWWHIDAKQMKRPASAAAALSFAISLGEFGATSFLTRSSSTTIPIAISQLLGRPGTMLQSSGFALAALLAIITAVVMSRA